MAIRLRNKITGTEREFSDRTAAAYLANPDNGWTKAAGKRSKKRSDDADPPADQED